MTGGSHDAAGKAAPSAPPVEETSRAAHADGHAGRKLLAASPEEEEEALQRFLNQAERQLSDPEIARRHEAMAHLRAAVAATAAWMSAPGGGDRAWPGSAPGMTGE